MSAVSNPVTCLDDYLKMNGIAFTDEEKVTALEYYNAARIKDIRKMKKEDVVSICGGKYAMVQYSDRARLCRWCKVCKKFVCDESQGFQRHVDVDLKDNRKEKLSMVQS